MAKKIRFAESEFNLEINADNENIAEDKDNDDGKHSNNCLKCNNTYSYNFWKSFIITERVKLVLIFCCVYYSSFYLTSTGSTGVLVGGSMNGTGGPSEVAWFPALLHTSEAIALLTISSLTLHLRQSFDSLAYKHLFFFFITSEAMFLFSCLPTTSHLLHTFNSTKHYLFHFFTDTSIFFFIAFICIFQPHLLDTNGRFDLLFLFIFFSRLYAQHQLLLVPTFLRRLTGVGVCMAGRWVRVVLQGSTTHGEVQEDWCKSGETEYSPVRRCDTGADKAIFDKDHVFDSRALRRKLSSGLQSSNNSSILKGDTDLDLNSIIKRRISLPTLQLKHANQMSLDSTLLREAQGLLSQLMCDQKLPPPLLNHLRIIYNIFKNNHQLLKQKHDLEADDDVTDDLYHSFLLKHKRHRHSKAVEKVQNNSHSQVKPPADADNHQPFARRASTTHRSASSSWTTTTSATGLPELESFATRRTSVVVGGVGDGGEEVGGGGVGGSVDTGQQQRAKMRQQRSVHFEDTMLEKGDNDDDDGRDGGDDGRKLGGFVEVALGDKTIGDTGENMDTNKNNENNNNLTNNNNLNNSNFSNIKNNFNNNVNNVNNISIESSTTDHAETETASKTQRQGTGKTTTTATTTTTTSSITTATTTPETTTTATTTSTHTTTARPIPQPPPTIFNFSELLPTSTTTTAEHSSITESSLTHLLSHSSLSCWDYPIFHLSSLLPHSILSKLVHTVFEHTGLLHHFNIPLHAFSSFFHRIEMGYHDHPYHNRVHASDVLHAVYYFTSQPIPALNQASPGDSSEEGGASTPDDTSSILSTKRLSPLELMSLYTAAAIHDFEHPGRTNAFLVSIAHPMAILYNDRSVLENHHSASAWKIINEDPCSDWLVNLHAADWKRFRFLVIEVVLATDLKKHFELVAEFNSKANDDDAVDWSQDSDRLMVMSMLIKMADINGPCKKEGLHLQWSKRIVQEFYMQGDDERSRGIPVSPFMDKHQPQVATLQASFINHLVSPLCHALYNANLLPSAGTTPGDKSDEDKSSCPLLSNLHHNISMWSFHTNHNSLPTLLQSLDGSGGGGDDDEVADDRGSDGVSVEETVEGDSSGKDV